MAVTGSQKLSGLFLVVLAAGFGYLLITLPPTVIEHYDTAAKHGVLWAYTYLATVTLGLLIIGTVVGRVAYRLWRNTRHKRVQARQAAKRPSEMSRVEKEVAISDNLLEASAMADDLAIAGQDRGAVDAAVAQLNQKRESQTLEIAAFGTISSGKSSLLNALAGRPMFKSHVKGGTTTHRNEVPWPGSDRVVLVDTPGLDEINGRQQEAVAREAAGNADLVLLVLDGPLRDSEFVMLKLMAQMEKRVMVCLNKGDWYHDQDRQQLLTQVIQQVKPYIHARDVVAVQANPPTQTRVRVHPDGSQQQETYEPVPDISPLAQRMLQAVRQDGRDLLLANLLLRSRCLVQDVTRQVREALDARAEQIIHGYMWRAGAVSAVVPFPAVDVAAGLTISTKMVFELARVYRQPIDLKAAERLLGQMGKNLVTILGSHAATPVVSAMIASALKSVPGIGTVTGGLLQGLTQAIVTRWIGHVFMAYFRQEMQIPDGNLTQLARNKWDQLTQQPQLIELAKAGLAAWHKGQTSNGTDPQEGRS